MPNYYTYNGGPIDWASINAANLSGNLSSYLNPTQAQLQAQQQAAAAQAAAAQQAAAAAAQQQAQIAAAQMAAQQAAFQQAIQQAQAQAVAEAARQQAAFQAAQQQAQQLGTALRGDLAGSEDVLTAAKGSGTGLVQSAQQQVAEAAKKYQPQQATATTTAPTIGLGGFGRYLAAKGSLSSLPSFGAPINVWNPTVGAGAFGSGVAQLRGGFQTTFGGARVPLGQIKATPAAMVAGFRRF